MAPDPKPEREPKPDGAGSAASTQAARMRAAVRQVVAVGPAFLRGDVDADRMANTMVHTVRHFVETERAGAGDDGPQDARTQSLQEALAELMACGSGYLAGRCDAACVARTMTQMVREYGPR